MGALGSFLELTPKHIVHLQFLRDFLRNIQVMRPPCVQIGLLQKNNVGLCAGQELDILCRRRPRLIFQFTTRMESGGMRINRGGENYLFRSPASRSQLATRSLRGHLNALQPRNKWRHRLRIKANLGCIRGCLRILRGRCAIFHHPTFGPGKSERGVQRDGPDQICSDHGQNERHVHEIKKRKEQQGIREKTAPDNELRMSAEIQERIRRSALRVAVPDFQ